MGQFTVLSAHWPFLLTVTPLFGAVLAAVQGRRGIGAARQSAMVNSTLTLLAALAMAVQFSATTADMEQPANLPMSSQFLQVDLPVAANRTAHVHVEFGVDGISLAPLLIVAVVGWVAIWTADHTCRDWSVSSYVVLLIGQSLGMALFAAQDALMFLVAGELWFWWLFITTGRQGGPERRAAARQVLLVGWLSHALWGLAIFGLAACHGWIQAALSGGTPDLSFSFQEIIARQSRRILGNEAALRVWLAFQAWVVPLWLAGLIVRWPLIPFHGWWPTWLSQARSPVAALGSTVLILETGYVWFRFVAPFGNGALDGWLMPLSLWAGVGLVWCGLSAVGQTDPRRLIGMLTLGSLQLAFVGVLSRNVAGELAAVQMLGCLSLGLTAALLCVEGSSSPHGRSVWTLSLCLLGMLPAAMFLSGGATIWVIEGRGYGISFLATAAGSALLSWAAIRTAFQTLDSSAIILEPNNRRTWLIALPVVLIAAIGLAPNWWQPVLRPAWDALHDPFAAASHRATHDFAEGRAAVEAIVADKPPVWQSASAVWAAVGITLLLWPRTWRTTVGPIALAIAGLCGGGLVELWRFDTFAAGNWPQTVWLCAFLIGLASLTIRDGDDRPSAETAGATLLRLAAAAFAARTADLALAGLAWELAELTRGLLTTGSKTQPARERWRLIVSSASFWMSVAMYYSLVRSTHLDVIAARLEETIPRDAQGEALGPASAFGLVATILLVSAIGCRSGLLPWSFGRDSSSAAGPGLLNGWLDRLIGLTMLTALIRTAGEAYGNPLCIMLCVSSAATALWSAATVTMEHRIAQILNGLVAWRHAELILLTAASAALAAFTSTDSHGRVALPIEPFLSGSCLAMTISLCGVIAAVNWIGQPSQDEPFIEHHQGLFAKRPQQAALLTILLLGLFAAGPLWGFWMRSLGLLSLAMTPQRLASDELRSHLVLLGAAAISLVAGVVQISKLADWLRSIILDTPISPFPLTGGWWLRALTWLAAAAMMLGIPVFH